MAKSTGVLYGSSKSYKTWNFGLLSKYIYEKTNKPILMVTADGGGYRPIQKFVDAGIIQPLVITNDPSRLALVRRVVEGYWPESINSEGERDSKKMVLVPKDSIGGYIFEGVTSIAESIHTLYRGKKTGMNPAYSEIIKSELVGADSKELPNNITVGGLSQDSYNLVQQEMKYILNYSWTLPADYIWWSGHEASATDELTNKVVRGIQLVGNAATPRIGKEIGGMIHAYKVEIEEDKVSKEKRFETRYYFQSHPDNLLKNVFWEASSRLAGDQIPDLLKKYPNGYFVPSYNKGLDDYLRTENELMAKGTNDVLEWKKKIDSKKEEK